MTRAVILRFLSIFSSIFTKEHKTPSPQILSNNNKYLKAKERIHPTLNFDVLTKVDERSLELFFKPSLSRYATTVITLCSLLALACEEPSESASSALTIEKATNETSSDQNHQVETKDTSIESDLSLLPTNTLDKGFEGDDGAESHLFRKAEPNVSAAKQEAQLKEKNSLKAEKPKKSKKPKKCRRGINKGKRKCKIERGHIHINRGKKRATLKLIDDQRRIIPEARDEMLKFLGDKRTKKECKKGFSFNFEYQGRASWRMYDCYVQDRLLWYLYLVGHHFDSEIHIVSGLRSNERKSSRHHNGHAVDFRVSGVKAKDVWEYCKRTFPLTGVGYYPTTHFVHLDVGRDHHQAYWVDSSGSGESASYKKGVSQEQRGRARKSQAGMISSIKRSLKRHYKSFSRQQKAYQERKKKREARRRKRKRRKRGR